ncbi:MAG: hypothetical protein OQK67_06420 [Chlorobium sp.]|nr:hypothetical protein [Chlorobium sp.]
MKGLLSLTKQGLLVLSLCIVSTVLTPEFAFPGDVLKIYKTRKLDAISLREIGVSDSGVSSSLNPFEASASWDGNDIETPELQLDDAYGTTRISRNDVLLWYYDYDLKKKNDEENAFSRHAYDVQYRIIGRNGEENRLSHKQDNNSVIVAHITEKPVECEKKNKNRIRCLGRVDLDFDISQAKRSGKYYGTIEITITTF